MLELKLVHPNIVVSKNKIGQISINIRATQLLYTFKPTNGYLYHSHPSFLVVLREICLKIYRRILLENNMSKNFSHIFFCSPNVEKFLPIFF